MPRNVEDEEYFDALVKRIDKPREVIFSMSKDEFNEILVNTKEIDPARRSRFLKVFHDAGNRCPCGRNPKTMF
jgi:hypothetical protein